MNEQTKEALLILQEECAEVTQAISKVFRFGFDSQWPLGAPTNKIKLEEEIGDLLAMIDILVEKGTISDTHVNQARKNKRNKLKQWSTFN
jgi:NTP pyrophosphatase (non-canonical NTP hydrolase)